MGDTLQAGPRLRRWLLVGMPRVANSYPCQMNRGKIASPAEKPTSDNECSSNIAQRWFVYCEITLPPESENIWGSRHRGNQADAVCRTFAVGMRPLRRGSRRGGDCLARNREKEGSACRHRLGGLLRYCGRAA